MIEKFNSTCHGVPKSNVVGLVDAIIPGPAGGGHNDYDAASALVDQALSAALAELAVMDGQHRLNARYDKFRKMGAEGAAYIDAERPSPDRRESKA